MRAGPRSADVTAAKRYLCWSVSSRGGSRWPSVAPGACARRSNHTTQARELVSVPRVREDRGAARTDRRATTASVCCYTTCRLAVSPTLCFDGGFASTTSLMRVSPPPLAMNKEVRPVLLSCSKLVRDSLRLVVLCVPTCVSRSKSKPVSPGDRAKSLSLKRAPALFEEAGDDLFDAVLCFRPGSTPSVESLCCLFCPRAI